MNLQTFPGLDSAGLLEVEVEVHDHQADPAYQGLGWTWNGRDYVVRLRVVRRATLERVYEQDHVVSSDNWTDDEVGLVQNHLAASVLRDYYEALRVGRFDSGEEVPRE